MDTARAIKQLRELRRRARPMRLAADGWRYPWQTLIAVLLSARTRDEVTITVGEKLFSRYSTLGELAKATPSQIATILRPVNFFRNKARFVQGCANALQNRFGGRLPHTLTDLISLPGVGRKTANVFLSERGEQTIGVDTHVAYIAQSLLWSLHRNPLKIEKDLERLFPRRLWRSINATCVHFGKTYTKRREKDRILSLLREL
ncbi:MAG TPA: endonuclease III [Candidatus Paceibacterota bacterium]